MLDYLNDLCTQVSVSADGGTYVAILKPEHAFNGERMIRTDAKGAAAGRWVTINGSKVLISGGKFVNGPFAGKVAKDAVAKYFTPNAGKIPDEQRAILASACADVDKNNSSRVYMDNYKIDLRKVKDFPAGDKVVVTAHNVVQTAGNNKNTITRHKMSECGDRLVELYELIKPKELYVMG